MEQQTVFQERRRLIAELLNSSQASADERIDRYLRAQHHGIVADTPFARASSECIELFRDGHFYGAISLCQAVGEALVRHMCQSNGCRASKSFEQNVAMLQRRHINGDIALELGLLWKQRNDYHHLNPTVATDLATLEP